MLRKRLLLVVGVLATMVLACSSPEEDIRPSLNDLELNNTDITDYVYDDPDSTVGNCTQCGNL